MKVLIGIAELQDSEVIVTAVKQFPWPAGSKIRVLSIAEKVHPSMLELMGSTVEDVQRKEDLRLAGTSSAVAADLRQAGLAAEANTVEGDPKTEIVEEAKRWGADLIVVGSDSDGRLKRVLLGGVATAVVTNAPCSVLVIRVTPAETRA
jgi:nucleotide-binding universal stress UspA family protein